MTNLLVDIAASPIKSKSHDFKVADAVWIAAALWHRENPEIEGFTTEQIVDKVIKDRLTVGTKKSVWQHVNQHCVANREAKPNRSRMLFALGKGYRRLFRDTDNSRTHPSRKGAPTHPEWSVLPNEFKDLQRWYEKEWNMTSNDPLSELEGTWTFGRAEDYLRELREGWD